MCVCVCVCVQVYVCIIAFDTFWDSIRFIASLNTYRFFFLDTPILVRTIHTSLHLLCSNSLFFFCVFFPREKRGVSRVAYYYLNPVLTTQIIKWSPFPRLFRETRESERKSGRQFIIFEPPCRSTRSRRRTRRLARCVFLVALFL